MLCDKIINDVNKAFYIEECPTRIRLSVNSQNHLLTKLSHELLVRNKMKMKPLMSFQPGFDLRMFVRRVIVDYEMQFFTFGRFLVGF